MNIAIIALLCALVVNTWFIGHVCLSIYNLIKKNI